MAVPCVLAFMPHPDDEAYSVGGTLARCADAGARVVVLCATRGEGNGEPARRSAELARSCEILGAQAPRWLDWPDGGVDDLPAARACAELGDALEELAPDVVLALGADGAYGHRDHLACARWLSEVVASLDAPPRVLHARFERGLFVPVWRSLRRVLGPEGVPVDDPAQLGVEAADVDLRVDVRAVAQRKRAAIAAHVSQLRSVEPLVFLVPGLVEALLAEEWFTQVAGPPLPPGATGVLDGLPGAS